MKPVWHKWIDSTKNICLLPAIIYTFQHTSN